MQPSSGYRYHISSASAAFVNQRLVSKLYVTPAAGLMLIIACHIHNIISIESRVCHVGGENNYLNAYALQ